MKPALVLTLLAVPILLSCGMTATIPTSEGALSQVSTQPPNHAPNWQITPEVSVAEEVGLVIVDTLTVRLCPSQACQVAYLDGREWYLHNGDVVMGGCYRFVDEIWLGFDFVDGEPTIFAAVLYDGVWLMDACR